MFRRFTTETTEIPQRHREVTGSLEIPFDIDSHADSDFSQLFHPLGHYGDHHGRDRADPLALVVQLPGRKPVYLARTQCPPGHGSDYRAGPQSADGVSHRSQGGTFYRNHPADRDWLPG